MLLDKVKFVSCVKMLVKPGQRDVGLAILMLVHAESHASECPGPGLAVTERHTNVTIAPLAEKTNCLQREKRWGVSLDRIKQTLSPLILLAGTMKGWASSMTPRP